MENNKLSIGMYVRTKREGIVKIDEIIDNGVITYEDDLGRKWEEETGRKVIRYIGKDCWNSGLDEKEILKASHNIIDLIEVGDYVNGCLVVKKYEKCDYAEQCIKLKGNSNYFYDIHVCSIVTKEQFESMSYKLGE